MFERIICQKSQNIYGIKCINRLQDFLNDKLLFGNSKSLHHSATNVEHGIPIPICMRSYFPESTSHGRNKIINALVNFIFVTE